MDYSFFQSLAGEYGPYGFILFMFWRLTATTLPRIATDNHTALEKQTNTFTKEQERQSQVFVDQLAEQRNRHEKVETDMCNRFDNMLSSQLSACREQTNKAISRIPKSPIN